ncbi:MAG: SDR family NAD(P)-dependent oxidoreductase [Hamadaea sp.]|nr:SDR family NAD(P)-dependent oxidoreductase [Hamadaea sp.]
MSFVDRYGPWALIAGASEGIGAAFARELSGRGLGVVLVARRAEPLAALAATLPERAVQVTADLATPEGLETVFAATRELPIGLLVANAALSPIGPFVDGDTASLSRAIDLNCRAPVLLARHYLPAMTGRGRGGLVVMSSLAGQQGSPGIAVYAGTKAFGAVFAESLWAELRGTGVDAIACVAGAVSTPGLANNTATPAPGTVQPSVVVDAALRALGKRPRTVPGALMRVSSMFMNRLLPRQTAVRLIGRASRDVLSPPPTS